MVNKKNIIVGLLLFALVVLVAGCAQKEPQGLSNEELEGIEGELDGEGAIDESIDREVESDLGELSGEEDELKEIESDEFEDDFSSDEEFGSEESLDEDVSKGLDF